MPSQDQQAQVCAPLSIFREDRDLGPVRRQRAPPRQVAWQALTCPLSFFLSKTAIRSHVAQKHPSVRYLLTGRNIWLDPSCLTHDTLIADISDETIAPSMSHVWKSFHRMSSASRIKSGKCQQISMKARPRLDKPLANPRASAQKVGEVVATHGYWQCCGQSLQQFPFLGCN